MNQIKKIIQPILNNNFTLVQLLGICPLLGVTTTAANALSLGFATTLVLVSTNILISILRPWIPPKIRIPIYAIIISSLVSMIQILINAYVFKLYQSLGIFIPLIVTNCIVMGRAEAVAIKNSLFISTIDGFVTGISTTWTMLVLGSIREIIGKGTFFDNADIIFGDWAKLLRIEIIHSDTPFLLAILPPGGFIILGLILAMKKYLIYKKRQTHKVQYIDVKNII